MRKTLLKSPGRALFLALGLLLVLAASGCSDNDEVVLGPVDAETEDEEIFAWLWAFDADQDSLRVYDLDTGLLRATFHADPHNTIHEMPAGPETEPTVWMGSQGTGYGFSAGFGWHGDHAHMELPTALDPVTTGAGNTHLASDAHGETVVWANDGDATFTLVDTETAAVTTLGHGSPHSGAVLGHEALVATHMNEKWARFIDLETGTVAAQVGIDTLAHGDAFHHDSETAFISCLNRVEVLDMEGQSLLTPLAYPGEGRCNFLLHGGENPVALGPVRLPEGDAEEVYLLDMANRTMEEVHLHGAALAWSRGEGTITLSGDGTLAVMTDLVAARAYAISLDPEDAGSVQTLTVAAAGMAAALDHNGMLLCLLEKGDGEVHLLHRHEGAFMDEGHVEIHPGTDWIFITSLPDGTEIIRDY